jgi:hypothetical protein
VSYVERADVTTRFQAQLGKRNAHDGPTIVSGRLFVAVRRTAQINAGRAGPGSVRKETTDRDGECSIGIHGANASFELEVGVARSDRVEKCLIRLEASHVNATIRAQSGGAKRAAALVMLVRCD